MIFTLLHEEFEPEMRALFLNSPTHWQQHLTEPLDFASVFTNCSVLVVSDLLRILALWRICADDGVRAEICKTVCLLLQNRCQLEETPPPFAAKIFLDAVEELVVEIEAGEPPSTFGGTDPGALAVAKANLQFDGLAEVKEGLLHRSEFRRAGACMACKTNAHFRLACKLQLEFMCEFDASQLVRRFAIRALEEQLRKI